LYGGDLGRIAEIIEGTNKVIVRLVPRLSPEDANPQNDRFASRYRFAKKFFDPTEFKEVGKKRDPATDITYMMYKNMIFHDGYLLKKMNLKNLELKSVNPSLEEIQFFLSREDPKKRDEVLKSLAMAENRRVEFIRGDMVRIIKGELTNLCGTIKNIQEDDVTIQPTMKELAG
jgi:transcription elongation factor SPT5